MGGLGAKSHGDQVGVVGQLWTWIPALVALGCAAVLYGRAGVRDLGRRLCCGGSAGGGIRCPAGATGVRDDRCRDSGVARRTWDAARPPAFTLSIPALGLTLLILALTDGSAKSWAGVVPPATALSPSSCQPILGSTGGCGTCLLTGPVEGQPLWLLWRPVASPVFTYVFLGTQGASDPIIHLDQPVSVSPSTRTVT